MNPFFLPSILLSVFLIFLTGCTTAPSIADNVKIDGSLTTAIGAGSGSSHAGSRARTGISF
ncbi:MAG: hypothetical protein ACI4P0_01775 [Mailhella sp.]